MEKISGTDNFSRRTLPPGTRLDFRAALLFMKKQITSGYWIEKLTDLPQAAGRGELSLCAEIVLLTYGRARIIITNGFSIEANW